MLHVEWNLYKEANRESNKKLKMESMEILKPSPSLYHHVTIGSIMPSISSVPCALSSSGWHWANEIWEDMYFEQYSTVATSYDACTMSFASQMSCCFVASSMLMIQHCSGPCQLYLRDMLSKANHMGLCNSLNFCHTFTTVMAHTWEPYSSMSRWPPLELSTQLASWLSFLNLQKKKGA